jgi:pyrroline-5-carboxylate reductase
MKTGIMPMMHPTTELTGVDSVLKIGILGVGELTEKVVIGLRRSGFGGRVLLSPRNHQRAQQLAEQWDCEVMADNQQVVDGADLLVLGVRPEVVDQLSDEVQLRPEQTLVSLVAVLRNKDATQAWREAADEVLERLHKPARL